MKFKIKMESVQLFDSLPMRQLDSFICIVF